ncbi:hypothetical protein DSL60_00150 [Metamycoplasma hominis]|uniref:hypothetical protein n=1 Tax=Metamycoplasma hominis TaxID=2098 RepID=UPI000DED99B8|nr:hypothetical protein [Metamycoplasma hominis]RCJ01314.1 hypothetical protein DSL60_00150 [Metamycoplasma hominis]
MKKTAKALLIICTTITPSFAMPLISAGCNKTTNHETNKENTIIDRQAPIKKQENDSNNPNKLETNSELAEAVKKVNFQYKDIDKISMFDKLNKENLSNNLDKKFKIEILKLEADKKNNLISISYNISFNDGGKIIKLENQKYSLTGLSTNNESYLNGLLNDNDTIFNLTTNLKKGNEIDASQLDAYYLANSQGSISLLASNKNVYVPKDLILEYTWNEQNETNKKFNGEVELDVSVNTKDNKTITRKNVKIANKIAEGVSDDYLIKYKKLTLNYKDADKTSIDSFSKGDIAQTLKNNFIVNFDKSSEEKTKKCLEDNEIKYEVKSITEISLEKKTINVNLQITLKNKKLVSANIEVVGFKGVEKVSDEQAKKIVDKLTFGDVYFPEKVKTFSQSRLNKLNLYIKDENGKAQLENPSNFVEYFAKNGINNFNKNYIVKYDKAEKKLITTLKLNEKEYTIETKLTHESKPDEWVNEVGKEFLGNPNEILASDFSATNLKLNKNVGDSLDSLNFIKLSSIKRPSKNSEELKLNEEGKATLIYEFRNIYDNSIYTTEVVFENLKKVEKADYKKQHASLIQKINDKKIIKSGWATDEEIKKLENFLPGEKKSKKSKRINIEHYINNGNTEILVGRVITKKNKITFGDTLNRQKEFEEIIFDEEFVEAVKKSYDNKSENKILSNVITEENSKHKNQKNWIRLTKHEGKWCILFTFIEDTKSTPYYVQIEK